MREITLANLKKKDINKIGVIVKYKGYKIFIYRDYFNGYINYKCDERPDVAGNHYKSIDSVKKALREEV